MRCRWVLLAGLMGLLCLFPAVNAEVFHGRYRLALGEPDRPIDDATVWVYVIGWGREERVEVGVIRQGILDVRFDSADVPELTPEILLVAIEFPDGRWYRGPHFPPDSAKRDPSV